MFEFFRGEKMGIAISVKNLSLAYGKKKILENVFKIMYNGNGNDTDTLKQREYLRISSISTKIFSTEVLVEKI